MLYNLIFSKGNLNCLTRFIRRVGSTVYAASITRPITVRGCVSRGAMARSFIVTNLQTKIIYIQFMYATEKMMMMMMQIVFPLKTFLKAWIIQFEQNIHVKRLILVAITIGKNKQKAHMKILNFTQKHLFDFGKSQVQQTIFNQHMTYEHLLSFFISK